MRYKHIIFDIDGTLIDTEYAVIHSLIKTITKITGNVPQYEDLKFVLGITGKDALKRLKIDDIDRGLEIWDTNMKSYYHTIHPFQGIKECLNYLLSNKYVSGIVTSKTYMEYHTDFTPLGLANYFTTVVCADDTVEHKPQAAPLLAYLSKAKINPVDAIYIGDSIYDIQCATSAGVDSGLVLWSGASPDSIKANYYFKTPDEICRMLSDFHPT